METKNLEGTRIESDLIGAREIPASALYGVQTLWYREFPYQQVPLVRLCTFYLRFGRN